MLPNLGSVLVASDDRITEISSSDSLFREGKTQGTCLNSRSTVCILDGARIFKIEDLTSNSNSVFEVKLMDCHFRVRQHFASENRRPSSLHKSIAARFLDIANSKSDTIVQITNEANMNRAKLRITKNRKITKTYVKQAITQFQFVFPKTLKRSDVDGLQKQLYSNDFLEVIDRRLEKEKNTPQIEAIPTWVEIQKLLGEDVKFYEIIVDGEFRVHVDL